MITDVNLLNSSRAIDHVVEKHSVNSSEKNVSKFLTSNRNEIKRIINAALQSSNCRMLVNPENQRVIRDVKMTGIIGKTINSEDTDSLRIISGLGNKILISAFPIDSIPATNFLPLNFFNNRC